MVRYEAVPPIISADFSEQTVFPSEHPALIAVHTGAESITTHWHAGAELLFVRDGPVWFAIDGVELSLGPGSVLLVSPYAPHAAAARPRGAENRSISVTFDPQRVEESYPLARYQLLSRDAPTASPADRDQLREACRELDRQVGLPGPENVLKINSLLFELLYLMYTKFVVGRRDPATLRQAENVIMPMLSFIHAHRRDQITAADVAGYFGYSREHFSRLFSRCAGSSFKAYLTQIRLESAHQLLMFENASLAHCAHEAGFPSTRAFVDAFERRHGEHPLAFRKRNEQSGTGIA